MEQWLHSPTSLVGDTYHVDMIFKIGFNNFAPHCNLRFIVDE